MKVKITLVSLWVLALAAMAGAQTKISGTVVCAKPDQQQAFDVGDRAGHTLGIQQGKCTWSKPMEIADTETKEDQVTFTVEMRGGKEYSHGYGVGTLANGDKFFVRLQGAATVKDGAVVTEDGKWTFTGGTGKLKGVKGGGTYKGKGGPEGVTSEVEGEYQLPTK
jgi:hypothetical protein